MLELAILVRSLQFYAHHAHHICARVVFFQDHEFLAEIYTKAEQDYDDIIERYIGLFGDQKLDEASILLNAANKVSNMSLKTVKENKEMFKVCLDLIKECNHKIELLCKAQGITQGTIQLLGDQANKNEVLIYKINQRIK